MVNSAAGFQAIDALIIGTAILLVITVMLFVTALFTRSVKMLIEWKSNRKHRVHTRNFVQYITGNKTLEQLNAALKKNPGLVKTYFKICSNLQFNVRGSEREKIQRFLEQTEMSNYYIKLLRSKSEKKIIEALHYFKEMEQLQSKFIKKILPLFNHKQPYIRYSAATAMMGCEKVKDRGYALELICRDEELTRLALYELLYKYRKKDKEQWEQEGKFLMGLLKNETVLKKHKCSIAIAMGGIGYYYQSTAMLNYLKELPINDDNTPLIAGLIEGLGMLKSPAVIEEIEKIIPLTNNTLVKKACMNALREINGKEGIQLLFNMLRLDNEPITQIESAIEIIKLDTRSLKSISSMMIPENANKELVSKIESETGYNFYLNTT